MKKLLPLIFFCCTSVVSFGQAPAYWQQQVDVDINVALNDQAHALTGDIKMRYQNNSPDTLHFIWMHLWPNAYKNDRTAFSEQLLQNGRTDFYFSPENKKGYINRLSFKVNNELAQVEDHPQHQDIVKIILPTPLPPAAAVIIETPFHEKLPEYFSRGGHINQSYMITQWYPKPAVYDVQGWHPMPYLDQGEFYSEFGNYKVNITVPATYKVAATGVLRAESKQDIVKTLRFEQDNVHDFAWFADKDFEVLHDTLQLAGKTIDVFAYYNKANAKEWANSLKFIKNAVNTKSNWLGEYPYNIVTVVEKAGASDGGGMEYPTITLISKTANEKTLDFLINHEVGHNWFYGILASNERAHPWMDEGMNSYYDLRYARFRDAQEGRNSVQKMPSFLQKRTPENIEHTLLQTIIGIKKDQPIATHSEAFSSYNYGLVAYTKTAEWLQLLERNLGTPVFDKVMQQYYEEYKFKHPQPADFKVVAERVSGKNLDDVFGLLYRKGSLTAPAAKDIRLTSFLNLR
ncbi:MAG: M1 family peptidase, partial [Chitinophagaceae bacterium]